MQKTTLKNLFLFTVAGLFASCQPAEKMWELNSPENNLRITVAATEGGETSLVYKVDLIKDGQAIAVIESSPLGIERNDQQFSSGLKFVSKSQVRTIDETYTMHIGRQTEIRNHANELELTFKNQQGSLIQLVLRAYNDGVAFRYVFPEKSDSAFTVVRELTGFKVPETGKAWIQRYDVPSQWTPAYEKFYEDGMPIGTASPNAEGWAFPALFNTNNNWVLISEANLTPHYCGIRMEQNAPNGMYRVRFPEAKDAEGYGAVEPVSATPWVMPWRTIVVGETLAPIFETTLINNLSDPTVAGDFSWVKPGRASWSWISENDSPKKFQSLKEFVDLAAEMNWEYSLVDANWDLMTGGNIEQLVQYANSKGVGILMWYNSGGPQNVVTERPRDIMYDPQLRKAEFQKLKEWGVKGVKIDFWHSDKQNMIALYHDVMKDAADNHILVNFHGCTIPRGWSRTYPNLIGLESVKGEECYLFDQPYTDAAPIQNTILPFTRNVIGPMDYTPVGFSDLKYPHITTNAHELALSLVFNVGILHFADNVKTYRTQPNFIKEFLKAVPAVFDETHFISGEPGKSIVMASRKGTNWYVAGINGEKSVKEISVELPFITSGEFDLSLISDGETARTFRNETKAFKAGETIPVKMLECGGFVAVLKTK
ncbi:MAG: glycoside hydrolase family 97 protein [Prolixibacteraceae bacterium]|nr:glycoside hydrolase family 97 protein [Prolixibacteraceae bacterium]